MFTRKEILYWCLASLFLVLYYALISINTINIPECDDQGLVSFLTRYLKGSFGDKIELLFMHGEHRLLFAKLVVLLSYGLTGRLNFSAFIIIANLMLIGMGALIVSFLKKREYIALFVLIIILLVFNGQNAETSVYSLAGLGNIAAMFFMVLSISLVIANRLWHFWVGVSVMSFTLFTNGNAFILIPVLAATLWLQGKQKRMYCFLAVILPVAVCYFATYKPAGVASINFIELAINYFCFIGNNFWVSYSARWIPCVVGIFICLTWIYAVCKRYWQHNAKCLALFTFMLITGAAVVINRPESASMGDQRFRLYGCVHLVLTLLFWIEMLDRQKIMLLSKIFLPLIVCFSITGTIVGFDRLFKITENKKASSYNWQYHKMGLVALSYPDRVPGRVVEEAESMGVYYIPQLPLKQLQSQVEQNNTSWSNRESDMSYGIDYCEEREGFTILRGWAYTNSGDMNRAEIKLYLIGNESVIKVIPYWECRFDVSSNRNKKYCGFFAVIPQSGIKAGEYSLGIEIRKRFIIPSKEIFSLLTDYHVTF